MNLLTFNVSMPRKYKHSA